LKTKIAENHGFSIPKQCSKISIWRMER